MLFFGHTGITLGAAVILSNLPPSKAKADAIDRPRSWSGNAKQHEKASSPFDRLVRLVDVRILLIGSLLPDIIDKPLGELIFRQSLANGRIYAHTLLFLILISAAGLYLRRTWYKNWLLVLSFGTAAHFLLDQMWNLPSTLFWPVYGLGFAKTDVAEWIPNMLRGLANNPSVYVPEAVGIAVLAWFAYYAIRRKQVRALFRYGKAESI